MYENKHPHGNMAVLVGATEFGQGASSKPPVVVVHPTLPKGDIHTTPRPYPMSEPLPTIAEAEAITIADDGTKVGFDASWYHFLHPGRYRRHQVAKIMIDKEIHAVVVMDGRARPSAWCRRPTWCWRARVGRPSKRGPCGLSDVMTPGCATCDADMLLSEAVSLMTGRRMHRLVVTENDQPVGVISMTDVVRKFIGE
jgi:crotonyl-CoA carboxylase/reductase